MHIIFISLVQINSLEDRGIYQDLLRVFRKEGHKVTVVCPVERRTKLSNRILKQEKVTILQVKTLNIQKINLIEKGLATISLNFLLKRAIKKYLSNERFDLILYTTPPITLTGLISYLKKKNQAKTYLLLKDIFPQNAVDMGMLKRGGLLHHYFSFQEKKLYKISDKIGCMSPANLTYLKSNHPEIPQEKLEVNPNSIEVFNFGGTRIDREKILNKFNIPDNKILFLYGGNLGRPQGLSFLVKVIEESLISCPEAHYVIVGDGTEYSKLNELINKFNLINATLIRYLPKDQYEQLAANCNVGLILLHPDFTIPNFPSRVLTYLENKMPILCLTDSVTDIGIIAEENNFGKWCLNGDMQKAIELLKYYIVANEDLRIRMGENGYLYLINHFDVNDSYSKIVALNGKDIT